MTTKITNKRKIVIYSNCHGEILQSMLEKHTDTRDKYAVQSFCNYENLHKAELSQEHKSILSECDVFIYQPFNRSYNESEYDVSRVKQMLKPSVKIVKINYYRFRAFWYNCDYQPYLKYRSFNFPTGFGICNKVENMKNYDYESVKQFIDQVEYNSDTITKVFEENLVKFRRIDDNSDIKMYDFFVDNYKKQKLFHDQFHPTNIFMYEVFRQLVQFIQDTDIGYDGADFISSLDAEDELTHWSQPILPTIRKHLNLEFKDETVVYHKTLFPVCLTFDVYEYYYVRMSPKNFREFLHAKK